MASYYSRLFAGSGSVETAIHRLTSNDSTLTSLDLAQMNITNELAGRIAIALTTNSTLTKLSLHNQIAYEAAGRLATALTTNSTLTTLYLHNNQIADAGAGAIATALTTNSTLTKLSLQGNHIADAGAGAIATTLTTNSTLTGLYLSSNPITDEGARCLVTALASNFTLSTCQLRYTRVSHSLQHEINQLIQSRQSRRHTAEEAARLRAEEEARLKAEEEARLKAEEEARLKADKRAPIESPFLTILDKFQISAPSRDTLFDIHGLEFATAKYLTFDDVADSVKTNQPPLLPLKIRALFDELKAISTSPTHPHAFPPSPSSPSTAPLPLTPQPPIPGPSTGTSTPAALPDSLQRLLIPIDQIQIDAFPLAEGADGVVFRAMRLGGPVVVKKPLYFDHKFYNELEKWCGFQHPNVVHLFGFVQQDNADPPFVVMESMDGSLHHLLRNSSVDLSWSARLKMAHGIAAGLLYLHVDRKVVHRDIKSLNVLVKHHGAEVKIADFGASRNLMSLISKKEAGTPRWVSPELYLGLEPTTASDIYALGITLNELLTRQIPFVELRDDNEAIKTDVLLGQRPNMDPFPSLGMNAASHDSFVKLIKRCWHQVPSKRPSALEVLQSLTTILNIATAPSPSSSSAPDYPNYSFKPA